MPEPIEHKDVYGITFEQGRNEFEINKELLEDVVTNNKEIPESAKIDLIISLITLKYTQSNSVCYAVGGQTIGVGAGQQSRIHCTRLAGTKADTWFLRQHEKVLNLPFKDTLGRYARRIFERTRSGLPEDSGSKAGRGRSHKSVLPDAFREHGIQERYDSLSRVPDRAHTRQRLSFQKDRYALQKHQRRLFTFHS